MSTNDRTNFHFSLQPNASRIFHVPTSWGSSAAGVAYLQMIRDGYVWCDHFENQLLLETAPTKRSPDFVFSRPNHTDVAITESKATHGSSRKQFGRSVENGYVEQVEPYLGMQISGATVSHGFAIGSWMTSPTRAELVIDHTAVPVLATPPDDVPSDPTAVKRGNYLTVLALMFGSAAARGARDGTWPSPAQYLSWPIGSASSGSLVHTIRLGPLRSVSKRDF